LRPQKKIGSQKKNKVKQKKRKHPPARPGVGVPRKKKRNQTTWAKPNEREIRKKGDEDRAKKK